LPVAAATRGFEAPAELVGVIISFLPFGFVTVGCAPRALVRTLGFSTMPRISGLAMLVARRSRTTISLGRGPERRASGVLDRDPRVAEAALREGAMEIDQTGLEVTHGGVVLGDDRRVQALPAERNAQPSRETVLALELERDAIAARRD